MRCAGVFPEFPVVMRVIIGDMSRAREGAVGGCGAAIPVDCRLSHEAVG
jgi:hypothetical protein